MHLISKNYDIFVPDNIEENAALARTTHLAVGAHQDDQEIMAYHGIITCFGSRENWFTGLVVTNGAGSARKGIYEDFSDEQMQEIRKKEQQKAAVVGEYAAQIQLGYSSRAVKGAESRDVVHDLKQILMAARPDVVYLHNPADKHDTHVASSLRAIQALRELDQEMAPKKVYGCEVWRDLDWLCDNEKLALPVSGRKNLAASLMGLFDSQISGGKRYDLATDGRRLANATYHQSHATDADPALTFAMNLTPLIHDPSLSVSEFILGFIDRFKEDVTKRLLNLSSF